MKQTALTAAAVLASPIWILLYVIGVIYGMASAAFQAGVRDIEEWAEEGDDPHD